ncbi:MAG TPA: hypothetical protein ENN17_05060 [bacterium]|nr:hypothetical protein [bacterium]
MDCNLVFEDEIHLNILKKILAETQPHVTINRIHQSGSRFYIGKKLFAFNRASLIKPHIVLADLDRIPCVRILKQKWITFEQSERLFFQVAVREGEAWLLADHKSMSTFLGISLNLLRKEVRQVENIYDPKLLLVNLARRSKRRQIRDGLVPKGSAKIGDLHNTLLSEYIQKQWEIEQARIHSSSLNRFLDKLQVFFTSLERR